MSFCYELVKIPFNLYTSFEFDKLHVFDHDVSSTIPDTSYRLFESQEYNKGQITKYQILVIAKMLFYQLLRISRLHFLPFWSNIAEFHSNITGFIRRKTTPLPRIFLKGMQSQTMPRNELFLQSAIELVRFRRYFRGINKILLSGKSTIQKIKELQSLASMLTCGWFSHFIHL